MRSFIYQIVVDNIHAYLRKTNQRPADLSKKSGLEGGLRRILRDPKANPTLGTLVALAQAMDTPLHELVHTNGTPNIDKDFQKKEVLLNKIIHFLLLNCQMVDFTLIERIYQACIDHKEQIFDTTLASFICKEFLQEKNKKSLVSNNLYKLYVK